MALSEISLALTGLKTAIEITKSISNKTKDINLKGKIIELQNLILSMQSEYSKLIEIKDQLEKELVEYKNWDKTKSQYELKEIVSGSFVYVPQKDSEFAKSKHCLCTNCFDDRKKSILQLKPSKHGYYFCPKCKTEIRALPKKNYPLTSYGSVKKNL